MREILTVSRVTVTELLTTPHRLSPIHIHSRGQAASLHRVAHRVLKIALAQGAKEGITSTFCIGTKDEWFQLFLAGSGSGSVPDSTTVSVPVPVPAFP